jgi:glucose-1-phosphate cytidylyltransferase
MNIQTLILCGGKGERLRPFTDDLPKPLVEINNKAILGYIIDNLLTFDITNIIIASGYKSEMITKYIDSVYPANNIQISNQGNVDIIERIKSILPEVSSDLIVMYGDTISDVDLTELVEFSKNQMEAVTVTLWPLKSQFGVLETDENNKVISYAEKPILNKWINIGYIYIKKQSFSLIRESKTFEAFLNNLVDQKELAGFKHKGHHITVNTLKELDDAEAQILKINNIRK